MLYIPIILICAKGILVCDNNNAADVIPLEPTNTPMACLRSGQEKLSQLAIKPGEGETYRIVCKLKSKGD